MSKCEYGWHFAPEDRRLRYGDDREVKAGAVFTVDCSPVLCELGLHASRSPLDALKYAPGPIVSRVVLRGEIVHGDDKMVATEREHLWVADATDTLRHFARLCALDVIHLWDAPPIVVEYLRTGADGKQDAAWAAAEAAARDATRDAAWAAAGAAAGAAARDATRDATRDAAWDAARDATWATAGATAGDAARARQGRRLHRMLLELGRGQ